MDGIDIKNVPHPVSTTFENIYAGGGRRQRWTATAARLTYEQIPAGWRNTPIVHLAPIAQEFSPSICSRFGDALVCVTVQGWLRARDAQGHVRCRPHPELPAFLAAVDILVFARSDLFGRRSELIPLLTSAGLAVETLGPAGCRIYQHGRRVHIPVRPESEIDPTGAGDIFAAAFFIRYRETGNAVEAARFANACAALSVRARGLAGVPDRSAVQAHCDRIYGRRSMDA